MANAALKDTLPFEHASTFQLQILRACALLTSLSTVLALFFFDTLLFIFLALPHLFHVQNLVDYKADDGNKQYRDEKKNWKRQRHRNAISHINSSSALFHVGVVAHWRDFVRGRNALARARHLRCDVLNNF